MLLSNSVSSEEKKKKKNCGTNVKKWQLYRSDVGTVVMWSCWGGGGVMFGGRTAALTRPMRRGRERREEKSEQVDIGSLEPWSGISPSRARIAPFGTSVDPGTHWTKPDLWPDSDTGLNPPPPLQHLGQEEVRYEKYEGVKGQIQCDFSLSVYIWTVLS